MENHHYFTSFAGSKNVQLLEEELPALFRGELRKIGDSKLLSSNPNFTVVFMVAHAQ